MGAKNDGDHTLAVSRPYIHEFGRTNVFDYVQVLSPHLSLLSPSLREILMTDQRNHNPDVKGISAMSIQAALTTIYTEKMITPQMEAFLNQVIKTRRLTYAEKCSLKKLIKEVKAGKIILLSAQ